MLSWLSFNLVPQVYAQCDPRQEGLNLGECFTLGVGGQAVKDVYSTPTSLINQVVSALFIAGGMIFFVLLIYSGFKFITNASKGQEEAKSIMSTAVGGLVIMFVAYWLVRIIEVIIGMEIIF